MNESCPICNSADIKLDAAYRGAHPIFAGLRRAQCSSCSMGFASPMPADKALSDYNTSYFSTAHGGQPSGGVTKAFFSGIARLRMVYIERYLEAQGIAVSALLELGPGPGFFACNWLEKRPDTVYMACETDTTCHAHLHRMGVKLIDAYTQMKENISVDLMVMSHVLEHVSDPIKFLTVTTQSLRKGGALFIEVPCRDYEHKSMDEPHLLFFDKEPLQRLLCQLGFDNIQVSYHGVSLAQLRSSSILRAKLLALRTKLITLGLIRPFARIRPGMEILTDPVERAAVAPSKAQHESPTPAWWLRAVATKC